MDDASPNAPLRHWLDAQAGEGRLTLLRNPRNLGFGAANNRALASVTTPYALLINPDCLPTPAFFDGMLEAARAFPDAAIIAPHLMRRNGSTELSYRWSATHWTSFGVQADGPCCVGFVCGAVMLINRDAMQDIGFFDETFFLYYEDEDLCQRVFEHGKQIVLVPDVEITHLSRGSVKGPSPLRSEFVRGYHHAQSKLIFEHKHVGEEQAARLQANLANQQAGLQVGGQNLAAMLSTQQLGTQTGLQTALANLSAAQQANVQNQAAHLQMSPAPDPALIQ